MLDKYRDWLMLNGSSENTAKNYVGRMERVLSQIPEESLAKEPLEGFLLKLQATNTPSTVNGYLNAIRSYLRFIGKEIPLPTALKEPQKLPESFDETYLETTILPTIAQLCQDYLKFKALFYFLFYAGIRISEIDKLKRSHFDLKKNTAKIYMNKTKKERIVFYNKKTSRALIEYFNYEQEEFNAFNITASSVQKRIERMKQNFPEINFHVHLFRHSFAVHMLRKSVDLLTVSQLLGHSDINSTMRYLGLTTDQMQEIYNSKIK